MFERPKKKTKQRKYSSQGKVSHALGRPPIGAVFTSASRIFRATSSCSSCLGGPPPPTPFSTAYRNTFGISSGRFSTESVTPAMKYHVCSGSCGCARIEESRAGVAMAGRVVGDIELRLGDGDGVVGLEGFSES